VQILIQYWPLLKGGVITTFSLCLYGWILGTTLGLITAFMANRVKLIGLLLDKLSFFLSSLPILITMIWLHYPLQSLLGIVVEPFITAAFCLTLYNTIAVASLSREKLNHLPKEYIQTADNLGISRSAQLRYIIIPILIREILPALLPLQVAVLHASMFASLISVNELFKVGQRIIVTDYNPVGLYTLLAFFYLALSIPPMLIANQLKIKFSKELSQN
jgi:polar amino acid transport system permease protein